MRINPFVYGVTLLVVFFGIILSFQAAGIWSISGKVDASGNAIQPKAGDVNSIKGWMTLEQITSTYQVSLDEIIQQFGLPADTAPATAVKDLESETFSVTELRTWLEMRSLQESRSQPGEPLPATPTPASEAATPTPVPDSPTPTLAPTVHTPAEMTITGKTTFQELLDWGVSRENIEKVIGGDLPAPGTGIKDYVTGKGLAFSTIKTQLQAEVDKTQ